MAKEMAKDAGGPKLPLGPGAPVEAKPVALVGADGAPLDPKDAENADLKAQIAEQNKKIDELFGMIRSGSVNVVEAAQDKKSREELEGIKAWVDQGKEAITQAECDRQFPGGKFRFRCLLADGNGHPQIVVGADNEVDAAARYLAVCGVQSSDKKVTVTRA